MSRLGSHSWQKKSGVRRTHHLAFCRLGLLTFTKLPAGISVPAAIRVVPSALGINSYGKNSGVVRTVPSPKPPPPIAPPSQTYSGYSARSLAG
jgi:hypothetical protein